MLRTLTLRASAALLLAWVLVWLVPTSALAQSQDQDLNRKVREIALTLRCPVCQNLSVADSPSQLATEMRAVIRQKLEAGASREEITQYFVQNYGNGILLDPPKEGFTLLIWLGAALAVVAGGLLMVVRVRSALASKAIATLPGESALPIVEQDRYEAMLDAELSLYKSGEF